MRLSSLVIAAVAIMSAGLVSPAPLLAVEAHVTIEIVTQSGLASGSQREWFRAISALGLEGLTVRSAAGEDRADIIALGAEDSPSYKIVGIVTNQDQLVVKGATFTRQQLAGFKDYVEAIRLEGIEGALAKRGAFGLSGKDLAALQDSLKAPIDFATKDKPAAEVVAAIKKRLKLEVVIGDAEQTLLEKAEPCYDDLQGMSLGTGLAALLRPYGLAFVPNRPRGGETHLVIGAAPAGTTVWPIGWVPEEKEKELVPMLYEFLNAEISGFKVNEVLKVLAERLKLKILVDHNALAAEKLDLATIEVNMPPGRTYYRKVLDRALVPSKLKAELRADEAGQPFLWVMSSKPAK